MPLAIQPHLQVPGQHAAVPTQCSEAAAVAADAVPSAKLLPQCQGTPYQAANQQADVD